MAHPQSGLEVPSTLSFKKKITSEMEKMAQMVGSTCSYGGLDFQVPMLGGPQPLVTLATGDQAPSSGLLGLFPT